MTDYDWDDPNRPFNPQLDAQDAEMVANAHRQKMALDYAARQEAAQAGQKFVADTFQEALAEAGLSQTEYAELLGKDPNLFKESVKEGTRSLVGKVARMRNARGQYIKAPPGQAPAADLSHDEVRSQARYGQQETAGQPSGSKTAALKAKTDKGYLPNEDELLDVIGELFE